MGGFDAVALVSGGKDSVMAAMMAESYGHRVVALANLLPADVGVEELDLHCFQTVGHRAVAAYGELTGLPLFRRRLRGSSKHTEMTYEIGSSTSAGDEVEDLARSSRRWWRRCPPSARSPRAPSRAITSACASRRCVLTSAS